jgi:hypothetical protein
VSNTFTVNALGKVLGWLLLVFAGFGLLTITGELHDWWVRPYQEQNSLYATCEPGAPAPQIRRRTVEGGSRLSRLFAPSKLRHAEGYAVDFKGCDVVLGLIACEGAAETPAAPEISQTRTGYALTRQSKYCSFSFETKDGFFQYQFD